MALTLDIPVRTSITLPDNWQDCQTPQQLSYWLIARFDELAKTNDINELKSIVAEVRAYVDTFGGRIEGVEAELTALENFLSDIDNTLTNLVRDVEDNTSDITTANSLIDNLHEAIIAHAQRLDSIEGESRAQNKLIQSHTQQLNALDNSLTNLSRTVSAQVEKFAGLTEAVVVNVTTDDFEYVTSDINKRVFIFNANDANIGSCGIKFELQEIPAVGSCFKFVLINPERSGQADMQFRLSIDAGDRSISTLCSASGYLGLFAANLAGLETPVFLGQTAVIDVVYTGGDMVVFVPNPAM